MYWRYFVKYYGIQKRAEQNKTWEALLSGAQRAGPMVFLRERASGLLLYYKFAK